MKASEFLENVKDKDLQARLVKLFWEAEIQPSTQLQFSTKKHSLRIEEAFENPSTEEKEEPQT